MKYTYSALILALVLLIAMLVNLFVSFNHEADAFIPRNEPNYHFVIVTQDNNDPFWVRFKNGAAEAGAKNNIFVEFVDVSHKDASLTADAVKRAILSDVDGIALQPFDTEKSIQTIKKAQEAQIPVITFENDVFYIPDISAIGSNGYEIGYAAGEMAISASGGKAKIAVMANDPGKQDSRQYNNIKLQGLLEAISSYPMMSVEKIYTLNTKMFEVEKLTTSILTENPEIDFIICNDGENTPGVAQVVIDSGKVGNVRIIGYGTMPQTMEYIEGGVMYGTIAADSYSIGYNTVMQLSDMCSGKQISEFVNTDIYTFTSKNLDVYKKIFVSDVK